MRLELNEIVVLLLLFLSLRVGVWWSSTTVSEHIALGIIAICREMRVPSDIP